MVFWIKISDFDYKWLFSGLLEKTKSTCTFPIPGLLTPSGDEDDPTHWKDLKRKVGELFENAANANKSWLVAKSNS